jgi:O-acetylserine/cysteine efflux transporter
VLGGDQLFVAEKIVAGPLVAVISFAYIALVSFVVAQVLWGRAIRALGVTVVSPFSLLIPIVGIWLAAFMLGERFSGQLLAWTGLAILGLGLHFFPLLLNTKPLAHGISQGK